MLKVEPKLYSMEPNIQLANDKKNKKINFTILMNFFILFLIFVCLVKFLNKSQREGGVGQESHSSEI